MLQYPLPSSISDLDVFRNNQDIHQFAEEHWAVLFPLCVNPIRVDKDGERIRVVLFETCFIERGINHEFIRHGDLTKDGKPHYQENSAVDLDNPANVERILNLRRNFDERFEFALREEQVDYPFPFAGSVESRREAWDLSFGLVVNELLQLPILMGFEEKALKCLALDAETVLLTRLFFGRAMADQVCMVHRNIDIFRRFENASPNLRRLIAVALDDKLIDGQGDILGEIWSLIRSHGVSRGALKKFMALTLEDLNTIRKTWRSTCSFHDLIRTMKLLHFLPVKLPGNSLWILDGIWDRLVIFQPDDPFQENSPSKGYFHPFVRMLAREIFQRHPAGELAEMEMEIQLVCDWIKGSVPDQKNPDMPTFVIDRQQEKAGWPWLMKKQEEWHRGLMGIMADNDNEWDLPNLEATHNHSWTSVLNSHQDGAFRVEALTDSQSLWKEGKRMRHCVGMYASTCYLGKCRIFSIEDATTGIPVATVELFKPRKESHWQLGQISGPNNVMVPKEIEQVAQRILQRYLEAIEKASNNSEH